MKHLTTPELIRALGGADAICGPGCSCRGSYTGPERRSAPRHEPCPNCAWAGPGTCRRCATYGAHGATCAHVQADGTVRP
jgi:hypothetical protein